MTVPAGGSLEVANAGTAAHNLSIVDSEIVTTDLAAGDTETLDLSSLEPGEYEILCTIPGHADSGVAGAAHRAPRASAAGSSAPPAESGARPGRWRALDHGAERSVADPRRGRDACAGRTTPRPATGVRSASPRCFVKICGITLAADAIAAVDAGADAIGLNFVPTFASLHRRRGARAISGLVPDHVMTVGIFRDHLANEVLEVTGAAGPRRRPAPRRRTP